MKMNGHEKKLVVPPTRQLTAPHIKLHKAARPARCAARCIDRYRRARRALDVKESHARDIDERHTDVEIRLDDDVSSEHLGGKHVCLVRRFDGLLPRIRGPWNNEAELEVPFLELAILK